MNFLIRFKDWYINWTKEQWQEADPTEKKATALFLLGTLITLCIPDKQHRLLQIYMGFFGSILLAWAIFRLRSSKKQIREQKKLIEEKQKELLDSIMYAQRLQNAILPTNEFITRYLPNNFVLYKPKDIVAGDFYWAEPVGDLFFIAAADSTGHGVPGAMVSVVCSNALNRTINEFGLTNTGHILDKARELVVETFSKNNSEVKDGMDISLMCFDQIRRKIYWSGAYNPLWYLDGNELREIKADKQPVGKTELSQPFSTHEIAFKENSAFYLFTDGFADQFGGPMGKKFKYKQFEQLLFSVKDKTMREQRDIIEQKFESWKGTLEQVDDVCVIGIRI